MKKKYYSIINLLTYSIIPSRTFYKLGKKFNIVTSNSFGFTLLELIIVFSIIAILSTFGVTGFVTFSREQTLNTTTQDIKTMLAAARSYSLSQLTAQCQFKGSFSGFQVQFCPVPTSGCSCQGGYEGSGSYYELDILCDNAVIAPSLEHKKLPLNVTTTAQCKSYTFQPITGNVSGAGTFSVLYNVPGFSKTKTITVTTQGVISSQ